jgi:hypothetical protein
VRKVRSSGGLRIDDRNRARAIQAKCQQARETIISPDSERARLCPRQPSFGYEIVEKRMQPEVVVGLLLARQRVRDLRPTGI